MDGPRLRRERRTIGFMIETYCSKKHGSIGLCEVCRELFDYAMVRLDNCPFGEEKTTCAKCPVHCYSSGYRERIREVMRFSGPRMVYSHPILALAHVVDGLKKPNRKSRS